MTKIPFKVSARAGKLLGRENFSNPEGALIELVKNGYDADARNCIVIFDVKFDLVKNKKKKTEEKIINRTESRIFIIDNGEGMAGDVIKNHWMKIGTGNKEINYKSDGKRIKTGAKGIGRFALDRLGKESEMWTLSKLAKNNKGFNWKMNWAEFDNSDKPISEINADLTKQNINLKAILLEEFSNDKGLAIALSEISLKKGTILKISHLKDDWFDDDIEVAFKSLEALIPPKELKIPFKVYFHHIQEPNEYGDVETAFFNDFDYKVIANYNAKSLSVDFEITRNELDLSLVKRKYAFIFNKKKAPFNLATLERKTFKFSKPIDSILKWKLTVKNKKSLIEIGSFEFSFYYLKYYVSKKEGYPYKDINSSERRSVLNRFGGVKIYRDLFRVRPYGESGNDWLKLGARVAQSPAGAGQRVGDWRVRPEQTAGMITISRTTNPLLKDKSDRGALQENESFEIFKSIIIGIIHEFEIDRSKILNPFYLYQKEKAEQDLEIKIQSRAELLAEKIFEERKKSDEKKHKGQGENEEKKAYEEAFKSTLKDFEEESFRTEFEEIVQVRSLASLGLIFSSFAHELKEIRDNATEIRTLERNTNKLIPAEAKKTDLYKDVLDILSLLKDDRERIKHWVDYSLTAIRKDKRKRRKLNLSKYFISLEKTWKRILVERNIELKINDKLESELYDFRAFEMDLNTIFSNLVNNSIDSFYELKEIRSRKISIRIKLLKEWIEIVYSDNGVGISKVFPEKEEIYLPFTTSKVDIKGNAIGTGLGMYLVKSVINDNNGLIRILEPQNGFSVNIKLPLRKK